MKKTVFMKKGALIDSCQKADATERRKTLHKKKNKSNSAGCHSDQ